MKRIFANIQKDARLFLFTAAVLEIYRAGFIFYFAGEIANAGEIGAALWAGFRMSLKTAGAVTLLSFCLVTLGNFSRHLRLLIAFCASLIFSALFLLRFPYFREYHSAFGIEIVRGLDEGILAAAQKIFLDYGFYWRFPLAFLMTIICLAIFSRLLLLKTIPLPQFKNKNEQIIFSGALILSVGIFAAAIATDKPAPTNDNFLNETILDDTQAIMRVAANARFMTQGNISHVDKNAAFNAKQIERTAAGARIDKPRHIFIIAGENLAQWEILGKYDNLHVADGLKSIIAESDAYYSRNFLPASNSTLGAVSAIVTGLPELNVYLNYQPQTFERNFICAFAPPFKSLGYNVEFWYGGAPNHENFSKMILAQGFDNFYSHYNLFEMLEKTLADKDPTVHLIIATNHFPQNITKAGFDYKNTLAKVKKLQNVPDADALTAELGRYWQMDKIISNFVRNVHAAYPNTLFVITGDGVIAPNSHPTIFEGQSVPLIIYGAGVNKNILPPNATGGHISIAPTLIELIAQDNFKYYSIAPSLFNSHAAFNREFFMTEKVAGKIDFDSIEILPTVAAADLDRINLAQERESAEKIIQTQRTAAWHILKGIDNENFGD